MCYLYTNRLYVVPFIKRELFYYRLFLLFVGLGIVNPLERLPPKYLFWNANYCACNERNTFDLSDLARFILAWYHSNFKSSRVVGCPLTLNVLTSMGIEPHFTESIAPNAWEPRPVKGILSSFRNPV